jgi:hypothetical protein
MDGTLQKRSEHVKQEKNEDVKQKKNGHVKKIAVPMGKFSPYGFLNEVERIKPTDPLFPPDFEGDARAWKRWFNETVRLIHEVLWPGFDQHKLTWVGPSAAHMRKLTDVDLRILARIRKKKPQELDKKVTTPVGALGRSTHRQLYKAEDGFIENWGTSYAIDYDVTLPPQVSRDFVPMIKAGVDAKVAETDIRFKLVLQRPRPYQMAFILGARGYDYEEAITANTPSICCGHCLQGLLGIGSIMEQIIRGQVQFSGHWEALEQFAVDIGDRRVMAGVHYPSDALCSWLISLRLANHVYRTNQVKQHLWTAIQRGFVYKLIDSAIRSGIGKVYEPAMDELIKASK